MSSHAQGQAPKQHVSQGGPTTEAGKQKQADAQAAKLAKQERKREKNRKKRAAYRARKNPSRQGSSGKYSSRWQKKPQKETCKGKTKQERKEEQKRQQKEERKRHRKEERKQHSQQAKSARQDSRYQNMSQEERDLVLSKAIESDGFTQLQHLFLVDLLHSCGGEQEDPMRLLTRRFRILSCRFHPDKHASSDAARYKVAFQALNEAFQVSREQFD